METAKLTITQRDIQSLREYQTEPGNVLTIYLDVDQSNPANLNRGFERALHVALRDALRTLNAGEAAEFDTCAVRARDFVSKYNPQARAIAVFVRPNSPLWAHEISVAVGTQVRWDRSAHIHKLVETLGELEGCAIVLADKAHARIFTLTQGVITKCAEIRGLNRARHLKAAPTGYRYSQARIQRKVDDHVHSYLKRVVKVLENLERSTSFQRLLMAGTTEATSELFRILPKRLRQRVIASVVLPAKATEAAILEAATEVNRRTERATELKKVSDLITAAAKGSRAVTSLPGTLQALKESRVRELLYAEGFGARARNDVIENVVTQALAEGATIEQVRGEAAEQLRTAGGIGAFLRF